MAKPLEEIDRERLRKIISVMRSATIEGERRAAETAATRLAAQYDLTLEEAEREAFYEEDDGQLDQDERQAQRKAAEAWAANLVRMTNAYESAEKYRYMAAREEARRRGLKEEEPVATRRANAAYGRSYIPTKQDQFRLIAGLLRDGATIRRTADIVGVSTNEVARVWLLTRTISAA